MRVVDFEFVGDVGLGAEVIASEAAYACFGGEEDVAAEEGFFKFVELGGGDDDVGSDAAAAGYLAAAVGELDLRWDARGLCVRSDKLIERNFAVVALNEAAAGGVVARGGEREAGVFAERGDGLDESLAEGGFADDQAAVVILHCAGDDFGGGGGVIVDQNDEGNGDALVAADGVVATLGDGAAVVRNDELVFVEEHVADGYGFIEQAAGIAAHVEDEAVELRGVELFEGFGDFAVGGFVEAGEADVADAGLEHESDVDGVAGNFVAGDGEDQRFGVAFASRR